MSSIGGKRSHGLVHGKYNAIPFNAATSPSYYNMIRSIGVYGRRLRPPSIYDLRTCTDWKQMSTIFLTDK
ncbi:hypothetical protein M5K25_017706 [Dendrobium thyrsiflorum]|uniref:Uncharacterized protein n=1 Tax=Dendrobium thyrsiflorum TaxID=117978 RepID=A0ABD0UNQ6_DENTH